MTPPASRDAGQPADPESVQDLGALLVARVPGLASIWRDDLGVEAAPLFAADEPVGDAVTELTEAIAICGVGTIRDDFQSQTRASLTTLVRGWRRAGLPGPQLVAGLARLGDRLIEELFRLPNSGTANRARAAACVLDATQLLIRRTERTLRSWESRRDSDDVLALGRFEEALAHELRNRIHAAETALDLLRRPSDVAPLSAGDRRRLHRLLLDAVRAARGAVYDMRRVEAFEPSDSRPVPAPLHKLVRRTVDRMQTVAAERGVEIDIVGPVSKEPVDTRAVRVALDNLLDVAVRRSSRSGGGRLRLQSAAQPERTGIVELHLDGAIGLLGGSLNRGHAEMLFGLDLVDLEGSDAPESERMSLWLAREAVEKLGGELHITFSGGAQSTLVLRIPIVTEPEESQ